MSEARVLQDLIAISAPEDLDIIPARFISKLQFFLQVAEARQEEVEAVQMQEQALG